MKRKNSHRPVGNRTPEPASREAACREAWVLDAVRYVFEEAMADRRR